MSSLLQSTCCEFVTQETIGVLHEEIEAIRNKIASAEAIGQDHTAGTSVLDVFDKIDREIKLSQMKNDLRNLDFSFKRYTEYLTSNTTPQSKNSSCGLLITFSSQPFNDFISHTPLTYLYHLQRF